MLMNLAELAAYVRDVKPESDVHSNLPNHRSPLENNGFNPAVFIEINTALQQQLISHYTFPNI